MRTGRVRFPLLYGAHKMMLANTIENRCTLDIVQASLGLISNELLGIWFYVEGKDLFLTIIVKDKTEEVQEDISDIVFELEALQVGTIDIETTYQIDVYLPEMVPPEKCRIVYIAKEFE